MFDTAFAPEDARDLAVLRETVRARFGIHFTPERLPLFESHARALCASSGLSLPELLRRVLDGDPKLLARLAERVSTNYTFFFREAEVFDWVANTLFPVLPPGPLRFWSAAASSGDEAYSMAMLALERLPDAASRVRILGTDLSERQVLAAEQATYPAGQLSQTGQRLARWFEPAGLGQHRVRLEARALCTFRKMNLTASPWPFTQRFHVIFLRNVLYYFEPDVRRRVVEACYDAAEPGAWLITSLTEPMLDLATRWRPEAPALFRKDGP